MMVIALGACGTPSEDAASITPRSTVVSSTDAVASIAEGADSVPPSRDQFEPLVVGDSALTASYPMVRSLELDGTVDGLTMDHLVASRLLLRGVGDTVDAAMVQVFDLPLTEMERRFGPFDSTADVGGGRLASISWYGAVWSEGDVIVAVARSRGGSDVVEIASLVMPWDGREITLTQVPEGYELFASHSGLPNDLGPAYVTTYSGGGAIEPAITVTVVRNPGQPARAGLANSPAELVTLPDGSEAVLLAFPDGRTASLVWDLPGGAKVTVFAHDVADATTAVRALADSLVPIPIEEWKALGG